MKSNTKAPEIAEEFSKDKLPENIPLMSNLEKVIGIPGDVLEETVWTSKALVRKREVKTAFDLLRIVLAYAVCDWSLRFVGAWCVLLGIGFLSDVAIRKRLKNCNQWLGKLIVKLLQARQIEIRPQTGIRLRMQDATVISKPGSKGTDFRIHVSLDLGNLCMDGIEVTDEHTGETLAHYETQPGDIRVGDRGYAFASSLGPVLASQGWLVVRANSQNMPLKTCDGQRFYFKDWLPNLTQPTECQTSLETPQGSFCLRTIACPLPPEKVEDARRRVRRVAQKKGRTPSPEALLAAGFVLLVTNLPIEKFDTLIVLSFYRLRWQIEVLFKRLKSLMALDHLRSKDLQLAQTYLLGKMLAALLIDQAIQQVAMRQPDWLTSQHRPASVWRITCLFVDCFRNLVRGNLTWEKVLASLPSIKRYLCSSPRRRVDQLSRARALLAALFGTCPYAPLP